MLFLFSMANLPDHLSFSVSDVSFSLRLVSHGSFQMGADASTDPDADKVESPVHTVTLTRDFYVAETPVTQALYEAVMGANPSSFKGDPSLPVERVTIKNCVSFISKLNKLIPDVRFSLPTEAEWEFAARGGNLSKGFKYAGSDVIDEVAWYEDNSDLHPYPVAQKKPNELGLYDMSGNVCEWCLDNFWDSYSSSAPVTDPNGSNLGRTTVARGGSYYFEARRCRSTYRFGFRCDSKIGFNGFRIITRIDKP